MSSGIKQKGMKCVFAVLLIGLALAHVPGLCAQEDLEGAKDHPLVSRLENFVIDGYEEYEFDSAEFYDRDDREFVIEGRKWVIGYTLKEGVKAPGQAKVRQNYIDAIRKIGGEILNETGTMKVVKDGSEVWIDLWVSDSGADYRLTIVEKAVMEQEVVADPEALLGEIRAAGRAAVYGIYFDTDSATIKPESEPTLKAIADLLTAEGSLALYVVGHTDMTGTFEHNLDLSARRAQSVVDALVARFGVAAGRLTAKGVGPLSPVGTNATDEGRKLNRRVELVAIK